MSIRLDQSTANVLQEELVWTVEMVSCLPCKKNKKTCEVKEFQYLTNTIENQFDFRGLKMVYTCQNPFFYISVNTGQLCMGFEAETLEK